jgi:long-chain acyl-CoA synthetase
MTQLVPSIASRIRARAQSDPKGVALREKSLGIWHETSWAQYGDLVERAAHGLLALGVRPGDRVAIQSYNRPEWVAADAAAVAARAVSAGIDPAGSPAGCEELLRVSGARVLIAEGQEQVDKALAAKASLPELDWIVYIEPRGVRDYAEPSLVWWPDLLARGDEHRGEHPALLDELAGEVSEDDPALAASGIHPDPGPSDFVLCHLPLWQVAGRLGGGWLNAYAGVQLHFGEPSAGLRQTLGEVQPSLFLTTPGILERLRDGAAMVAAPKHRLEALALRKRIGMRKCRSAVSVAPLDPELHDWYAALGIPLRAIELMEEVA